MTAYITICLVSIFTAGLTLYSGFGLGTILMPIFAIFFPIEIAVAATAVVHAVNNCFKIAVVGKHSDKSLVLKFGLPAIAAAFIGAWLLNYTSKFSNITSYNIASYTAEITPLKLIMGFLMFVFAMFELLPKLRDLKFDKKYLTLGGVLSGFFGGFSGHQGALRSAFLVKVGISPQAFVGTNAVIGFMVDAARITIYAFAFFLTGSKNPIQQHQWNLIIAAIISAFVGIIVSRKFLHKITMKTIQTITGILLLLIALSLASGII